MGIDSVRGTGNQGTEILPFLCLAKTVLHDPDWLLLDEPFADLSSASRNFMIKTLLMLQEQGKSIVVNSQMFPETRDFFYGRRPGGGRPGGRGRRDG